MFISRLFNRVILEVKKFIFNDFFYSTKGFSQEGEDLILSRYLDNISNGFYVDIGAHHPKRLSNTYIFYKKGWCGINIDPMPGSMRLFNKLRKRDINLEVGISNNPIDMNYYIFNEKALNTFSENNAKEWSSKPFYEVKNVVKVKTMRLKEILFLYKPKDNIIHFMSIDVEGFEQEVLDSNDWENYRPLFLIIEDHSSIYLEFNNIKIVQKMNLLGYKLVSKLYYSLIFRDVLH